MTTTQEYSIPGYEIGEMIGEGGFAKVFLAEQVSLARDVALKVVAPELASDEEFCQRFLKEGRIIAQLSEHPNIITIHDIGCHQDCYYMSMEFVGGGTLSEKIRAGEVKTPAAYIREIAKALAAAHRQGFVHRDIKPANILFKLDGTPVLTDFGIAKSLSGATQLTQAGFAVGTPDYMSPEQAMSKTLDGRSDLYSLGVVFYEALTGKKPFVAEDAFSVAVKHINEPPPPLPPEHARFQPLLDRLLAKNPDDRYASAEEFLTELDRISPPGSEMEETSASTAQRSPTRKKPLLLAGGAVAAVLLSVSAVIALVPGRQEQDERPLAEPGQQAVETGLGDAGGAAASPFDAFPPKVRRLLEVASLHEEFGRITDPPGSNACEAYRLVLDTDPDNSIAKKAVQRIGCP